MGSALVTLSDRLGWQSGTASHAGVAALVFLLLVSLIARLGDFREVKGAQNLEASYHVLLTVTALGESGPARHRYLPTVTLGADQDRYIPWGATVAIPTGDYVYTSFTPPAFLAPYVAFKLTGATPSLDHLAYFNALVGGVAALILFFFLRDLLLANGYELRTAVYGALVGSAIAIFSREALQGHGLIYWSQSLYQPILIASIYLAFLFLSRDEQDRSPAVFWGLVAGSFCGALTEWTGYVFNAGLIAVLFWQGREDQGTDPRADRDGHTGAGKDRE